MSSSPLRTRETLALGDTGTRTKRITSEDLRDFAEASGDFNPVHLDEEYARTTPFGQRIAHGVLTAGIISSVLGGDLPGVGTIFVELHIRFLKPVYIGDTITANATVMEIINPRRIRLLVACVNQHGEDVAIGNAIVVPPLETKVILD
jgi:3-hydroxybutyryl-CoA dehydratase